mmetsp:Transcript_4901/g.10746  ORF Transcript_4901/g.10746 Transcript_4901/m.10746 type:complete len:381 (+) Transcript_4901:278-1420(+)|eukprot:CAMPEP_0183718866 /NCGR_PEP_ID=MMETSP0737-20130205/12007_1 /TAXON_ID=385413 /ORGANISM="Thalassiosira miniscula, Strain CCMP1093" /LENGTH=380 /DNA_ID=CAMNT_0025948509 /DNA_START=215 /DNA_END=1357 /DNA_ORIENTATION=+
MSHYRNQNSGDGSWSDFFGDVYSGIAVGIGHPKWFVEKTIGQGWRAIASLGGISTGEDDERNAEERLNDTDNSKNSPSSSTSNKRSNKSNEGLKVVGVGYGRTGTYSLALALDELGYPTLHTQHLYENGKIFDHLVENIFYKSIETDEIVMGNPDFNLLLEGGFAATMDLPFALYFDQIMEQYPECKFILTVRENSDVWFRSWDVLTKNIAKPAQYTSFIFTHVRKLEYYMRWLFSVVNTDKKFLSHSFPLPPQNKHNAISSYEKHNQLVRDSIPSSRLLEYSVKEGCEPLCQFLEIPSNECPTDTPFPRSNSARAVTWQSYSAFIGPLVLTVLILSTLLSLVVRKVTGMTVLEWCRRQKSILLQFTCKTVEDQKNKKRS